MKKLVIIVCLLVLPTIAEAWQSETGSSVVSQNTSISGTSIEATQSLQSDVMSLLYGETRFGGATNYASFNSAGVLDTRNVAQNRKVYFNKGDSISWDTTSTTSANGVSVMDINHANNYIMTAFKSPKLAADEASIDTLTVTNAYITNWAATGTFSAVGNATFGSVSATNVTTTGLKVTSEEVTQSRMGHIIAADGSINHIRAIDMSIDSVSVGNITAGGATLANVNVYTGGLKTTGGISADNVTTTGATVTSLDVTGKVKADYITTVGAVDIATGSSDSSSLKGTVTFDTVGVSGKLKVKDLRSGSQVGTALFVGADGSLCLTGQCT